MFIINTPAFVSVLRVHLFSVIRCPKRAFCYNTNTHWFTLFVFLLDSFLSVEDDLNEIELAPIWECWFLEC